MSPLEMSRDALISGGQVKGVELYVSEFQRPITDRLAGNFFSDPAQAAVTCVRTGPMELAADINESIEGEEVFSQARSLLFKSVNVRRLYDREMGTIVYVSYSTRLNKSDDEQKSRFKTTSVYLRLRQQRCVLSAPRIVSRATSVRGQGGAIATAAVAAAIAAGAAVAYGVFKAGGYALGNRVLESKNATAV